MSEIDELTELRAFKEPDRAFILATWLRGLYYGSKWFREIDKDAFMQNYHKILEGIINLPQTAIIVACLREDPNVILGYCVCNVSGTIVHWIFVKEAWRRSGIAKKLFPKYTHTATHMTKLGKLLKPAEIKYNPFAIGE